MRAAAWLQLLAAAAALVLVPQQAAAAEPVVSGRFLTGSPLRSGSSTTFLCEVRNYEASLSVRLQCPLAASGSNCFENCLRFCADPATCREQPLLLGISCSSSVVAGVATFAFAVADTQAAFSGAWSCSQKVSSSASVQLRVVPDPSVASLAFSGGNVVAETQPATATCTAMAKPGGGVLRFEWRRVDSKKLEHPAEKIGATSSRLRIARASRSDAGDFECVVVNELGQRASRVVRLAVNFPPDSVRLVASVASPQAAGARLSLSCQTLGGKPRPSTRFWRLRIGQASPSPIASPLTLQPADNGARFSCSAGGPGVVGSDIESNFVTFSVQYPPAGARLLAPVSPLPEAAAASLLCSAESASNPASTIAWFSVARDGVEHSVDRNATLEQTAAANGGLLARSRLALVASRDLHGARVGCRLSYQSRVISERWANLSVSFGPAAAELRAAPSSQVREGEVVQFSCTAGASNPAAGVTWLRTAASASASAANVTQLARRLVTVAAGGVGWQVESLLSVGAVRRNHNGDLFSCVIFHLGRQVASLTRSLTLRVLWPPSATLQISDAAPILGQKVVLRCDVAGGSPSSGFRFAWSRAAAAGGASPASLNASGASLTLATVTRSNVGRYTCRVASPGGVAEASSSLEVRYAPILAAGARTVVTAKLGEAAELEARVEANPRVIRVAWLRGGELLANSSLRLAFASVADSDFGDYRCRVGNAVGESSFAFSLSRPGPPSPPAALRAAKVTAVSATLTWRSGYDGGYAQTFDVEWRPATSDAAAWRSGRSDIGIRDPGRGQLALHRVEQLPPGTSLEFRARSRNSAGVSDFSSPSLRAATRPEPRIAAASLAAVISGSVAQLHFAQPSSRYYTQVLARVCAGSCVSRSLLPREVAAGRASVPLPGTGTGQAKFQLLVMDGNLTVSATREFAASPASATAGVPVEVVIAVAAGSAGVALVLLAAVVATALMQRRRASLLRQKSTGSTTCSDVAAASPSPSSPHSPVPTSTLPPAPPPRRFRPPTYHQTLAAGLATPPTDSELLRCSRGSLASSGFGSGVLLQPPNQFAAAAAIANMHFLPAAAAAHHLRLGEGEEPDENYV